MNNNKLIELTGLWERKDKNGNRYYTGKIGPYFVNVFKNSYKTKDEDPNFRLMISVDMSQDWNSDLAKQLELIKESALAREAESSQVAEERDDDEL